MLQIPPDRLSPAVLDALIEEFVTRHGTELSDAATKAAQVRAKLRTGEVIIVFDETHETTNIVPKTDKPLQEPEVEREPERPVRRAEEPRRVEQGEHYIEYDEPAPPDSD